MLLNTIQALRGITDITPHSLTKIPFSAGKISQNLINKLTNLTLDICQEINDISLSSEKPSDEFFSKYSERFKSIRADIVAEIPNKCNQMRFTPEEYIEVIYIITYQLHKCFGITQEFVAKMFGMSRNIFKSKWGISPTMDCDAYSTTYQFKLPFETETDFLETIIPYIGKKSAVVSNDYFIGVSNNISIFANIAQTNKSTNRGKKVKKFCNRQFFHVPTEFDDFYFSFFVEYTRTNPKKFREIAVNILDTSDVEVSRDLIEYLINIGYEFEKCNLNNNNFVEFTSDYERYRKSYDERNYWLEAKDDPDHDFDDAFLVTPKEHAAGRDIDKVALCESNITRLSRELDVLCDKLIESIDLSSFVTEDNIGVLKFVIEQYEEELNNFKPDYFEHGDSLCAKYFIVRYFKANGVSETSVEDFKKYLESADFAKYTDRYENDYLGVLQNGVDINSKRSFIDIFNELKDEMIRKDSKKDDNKETSRNYSNALIYIDASSYDVTDELMTSLREIHDKFYFIVSSEVKLSLGGMQEEYLRTDYRELYLYTNI